MGSPQQPTAAQYAELEAAGQLQEIGSPRWAEVHDGSLKLDFSLPIQGVSLIQIDW
jgi:xylan 1,4-beta-xylosidase